MLRFYWLWIFGVMVLNSFLAAGARHWGWFILDTIIAVLAWKIYIGLNDKHKAN